MIPTFSHSHTASYSHMYFIPPFKSVREEFFNTSAEESDLPTGTGKAQKHREQLKPMDEVTQTHYNLLEWDFARYPPKNPATGAGHETSSAPVWYHQLQLENVLETIRVGRNQM